MPKTETPSGEKPAERVFLIDSMSHIFRAFYAPLANRAAPLMTAKGQVTQAVYIFTNMLRKLIQDEKPKYIAAVFESKKRLFGMKHSPTTKLRAPKCRTSWLAIALHSPAVRGVQRPDD
jgi:5'-3' exonuclease